MAILNIWVNCNLCYELRPTRKCDLLIKLKEINFKLYKITSILVNKICVIDVDGTKNMYYKGTFYIDS